MHEGPKSSSMAMDHTSQKKEVSQKFKSLGSIPVNSRLKALREDILNSQYHICTQKALLLTEYFRKHVKIDPLTRALSAIHYKAYVRSIEKASQQVYQKRWQVRLNNKLNAFYIVRERLSKAQRRIEFAKAFRYILENMELRAYELELIVGNPSSYRVGSPIHPDLGGLLMLPEIDMLDRREQNPLDIEKEQIRALREEIFPYWFNRSVLARIPLYSHNPDLFNIMLEGSHFILTQFAGISHVTPDYPTILRLGFKGIRDRILNKMDEVKSEIKSAREVAGDPEAFRAKVMLLEDKLAFYEASRIVAEAAINYGRRWSAYLKTEAEKVKDDIRKAELLELSDIFKNIPENPASSFYEAVQCVFITHAMLHQESFQHGISFGRMDQYLYDYYKQDIENGKITPEKAVEILGCFVGKAGELLPLFFNRATEYFSGLSSASGITLGGKNEDGSDAVNELSYLILLAYDQIRLRQPNFHIRVHPEAPPEFLELSYEVLKKGGGLPAFFNDETIVPAMVRTGFSEEDAIDYSIVGCVEWGCPNKSFPAAGAGFINLAMALHLALHNGYFGDYKIGQQTGLPETFKSMEDLLSAYKTQLVHMLSLATEGNDAIEMAHAYHRPTPFLSIIIDGCIDSGEEINDGGAIYNTTGFQGIGIADVVDSLTAIEQIVFNENKISLKDFTEIIDDNFSKDQELRDYIVNKVPKYGENTGSADRYAGLISEVYAEEILKFSNPRGGKYAPGFWSMTTHQGFGRRMGALPSGRLAGVPLANGISPCNGWDRKGPTASMVAASHINNSLITNGYALNQKLNLDYLNGTEGNMLLDGLIRGYFDMGGMQVQFNIVDPQILIDAKKHPERYPDLVVRVSGYSAYFNDLTESMKEELIDRTLHCLENCSCG